MSDTAPAPGIHPGTPEFRRMNLALMAGGFATFAVLYCVQPLLPAFVADFHHDAASASLAVSLTTGGMAGCLLFTSVLADRMSRRLLMGVSLVSAAILTLFVAVAPSWPLLLAARALTGLALSGVPAVALTYVGEEVDGGSIGLAVGMHISGNIVGGMAGRLATGVLADHFGWRGAVGAVGASALVAAILLWVLLPSSRRFVPRHRTMGAALAGLAEPFRDRGLPWLFLAGFTCMGAFVTIYNFIGFRLLGPPYNLSQTVVGLIFTCYLLGVVSSTWVGDLAGRVGRRKVFWATMLAMVVGVGLTAARPLPLVILGVAVLTVGFFSAHSTASSWVGRRAGPLRAAASSLYLFFYYLGGSLVGPLGGLAWGRYGWSGVAVLIESLLAVGLAVSIGLAFLQPLPGNEPSAQKTGK